MRDGWVRRAPLITLLVGVLIQAVVLVNFARQLWFAMDDWDMLLTRGTIPGEDRGLWAPHNNHWSTVIIGIYRVLFEIFGLRTYLPYALVTIVFHLAIALVVHRILLRVGAGPWGSVVGAWIVLFMGAGADAVMYSAAMNHLGSLLTGLLAVLVTLRGDYDRRSLRIATVLALLSVMFSATGIAAVCFVVVFTAVHDKVSTAVRLFIVPAVAYVVWYTFAGHLQQGTPMPADGWAYLKVPQIVWESLSAAVGNALGYDALGPTVLVVLVLGSAAVRSTPTPLRHLAWAGILTAVVQAGVLAVSRMHLDPSTGRYSYFTVLFLAPAAVLCLRAAASVLAEPRWLPAVLAAALLVGYAANGIRAEREFFLKWQPVSAPWKDRVLGMVAAVDAGERPLNEFSGDFYNGDVNPRRVSTPEIRSALPAGTATPQGRLIAERMYMVKVGTTSQVTPRPGALSHLNSFATDIDQVSGCRTYPSTAPRPVLVLGTGGGNEVTVTSPSTEVVVQLTRGSLGSGTRAWPITPGQPAVISSTAKGALLFMAFNQPGDYTVCM